MRRILIVQLRQLGDILLTTPIVRLLKAEYPDCEIDFLSHKMGKLILKNNSLIHTHIVYPDSSKLSVHLRFLRALRAKQYDLVFDFMNNPRSAFLTKVSRGRQKIGFKGARSWAYTDSIARGQADAYIVAIKTKLLEPFSSGVMSQQFGLDLPYTKTDLQLAQDFFEGGDPRKLTVVLSPTHRREIRRWSDENFADLAHWLVDHFSARVLWAWGPGEKDFVSAIQRRCAKPTQLMPETSFHELAAFFGHCDLFIGTSNGPSHVAVASGCPSIQLHGHTNALSWCPNTVLHRFIQSEQYGLPNATLQSIALDQVKHLVLDMKDDLEQCNRLRFPERRNVKEWKPATIG